MSKRGRAGSRVDGERARRAAAAARLEAERVAALERSREDERVAALERSREDELVRELVDIADELAAIAEEVGDLRRRRDEVVAGLRGAGYSWGRLAGLAGTSRQALMERDKRDAPGKQ